MSVKESMLEIHIKKVSMLEIHVKKVSMLEIYIKKVSMLEIYKKKVSMLEIYNEKLRDLLDPNGSQGPGLKLKENKVIPVGHHSKYTRDKQ